jgi:hypothetical protein
MTVTDNASGANAGLSADATLTNLYTTVAAGIPGVPTPAFQSVRSYADQLDIDPGAAVFAIDPNIKQPRVHQVSVGSLANCQGDLRQRRDTSGHSAADCGAASISIR